MIAIGIDIGGTSIKGASINEKGEVLDRFSLDVNKKDSPEKTVGELCDIINKFIKDHNYQDEVKGIGVGVPGIADFDVGVVISSPNLPTWNNFNLKKFINKNTGLPVELNNDANVAALGEATFGSAKAYKDVIMLTLGTGVGGGIIIDKKIYDGHKHQGAELGHMVIRYNGRKCGCGRKGCFEAYASATGLIIDTKAAMEKHSETLMHEVAKDLGKVDARVAFTAARNGDKVALKVINNYIKYLGCGIINYCNIFRPEVIVLSGGVANEGDYLFKKVNRYIARNHYGMVGSPKVKVIPASLGYDSGKIGAACLILNK